MKSNHFSIKTTQSWLHHCLSDTPLLRRRLLANIFALNVMGLATALLRLSNLGPDPYSCLNLGISLLSGISFGTCMVITCAALFIPVFLLGRQFVKVGTVLYLILLGPLCDLYAFLLFSSVGLPETLLLPSRMFFLIAGILSLCLGVAFYLCANVGLGPYDALNWIIEHRSNKRISYKWSRIICDVICVIISFLCTSIAGVGTVVGIGTVALAFCTGPIVSFFNHHAAVPFIYGKGAVNPLEKQVS